MTDIVSQLVQIYQKSGILPRWFLKDLELSENHGIPVPTTEQVEKASRSLPEAFSTSNYTKSINRSRHVTILGIAPCPLIRALGKRDYDYWSTDTNSPVLRMLQKHGVEVQASTIGHQLRAGKCGTRGQPAKITEEQYKILLKDSKNEKHL